jgi:excisionase family DNA binding protein
LMWLYLCIVKKKLSSCGCIARTATKEFACWRCQRAGRRTMFRSAHEVPQRSGAHRMEEIAMYPATPVGVMPAALSIADACRYVGCGKTKLYSLLRTGQLVGRKLGRRTLVLTASLDSLLAALPSK